MLHTADVELKTRLNAGNKTRVASVSSAECEKYIISSHHYDETKMPRKLDILAECRRRTEVNYDLFYFFFVSSVVIMYRTLANFALGFFLRYCAKVKDYETQGTEKAIKCLFILVHEEV